MADTGGPASDHLSFFRAAAEKANYFGFFALMRQAEALGRALPRVGRSRLPEQNVADLAHAASMDFPGPTLQAIEFGSSGRARVRGYFLGLTGPMGALPLHLTEFAHYERRYSATRPFGRFLDLLTDRMLQFFYRSWADSQPTAHADRPEDDRFAEYLANLTGDRSPRDDRTAFPPRARIHYLGILASRRSPAAIQDFLSHLIGSRVRVQEFVQAWREIVASDSTRLSASGSYNRLGRDAVLGQRICLADTAYRVLLHSGTLAEYRSFLPRGPKFAMLREALDIVSPSHLEWQLQLEIGETAVAGARLDGNTQLGWDSWLAPGSSPKVRADVRLRTKSRAPEAATRGVWT